MERIDLSATETTDIDLTEAVLEDAVLRNTVLTRANLTRTNLFGTDLREAEFHGAVFTDTQIDEHTQFGEHYTDEKGKYRPEDYHEARWCNRKIEQLAEQNSLPQTARDAYLRRKQIQKLEARHNEDWTEFTRLTAYEKLMGYGESLARVFRTALSVILFAALLYPLGLVKPSEPNSQPLTYPLPTNYPTNFDFYAAFASTAADSLYFSVMTFTTLGYGDFEPVGFGRALATAEAAAGVTLFALLVFVLGRRATR